jgi:hypothetical protein
MTPANMRMSIFRSGTDQEEKLQTGLLAFGGRKTHGQHALRNLEILRERESGTSLEELAHKYGLQRATVKALLIRERHRRAFALLRQPSRVAV